MRLYRALLRGQGTSIVGLHWAGCIIKIYGFDLRQAQPIGSCGQTFQRCRQRLAPAVDAG
jgi:hypothetical protein